MRDRFDTNGQVCGSLSCTHVDKKDYVLESKSIYVAFLHSKLKGDSKSCPIRLSVEVWVVELCNNRYRVKLFQPLPRLPLPLF